MTDERFKVALGCYDGIAVSNHFGTNPVVGTSFEVVREAGGVHTLITTATLLEVTSSSTDDASDGTGARIVKLDGLDANYVEQTENVILNGQTPVLTTNTYLRINQALVISAGSGMSNAGDLYICDDAGSHSSGVPTDLSLCEEKIPVGFSLSESTIFTVPADKILYINTVVFMSAAGKTVTIQGHLFRPDLGTNGIEFVFFEGVSQDTEFLLLRGSSIAVPSKGTIWMEAKVDSNTAEVTGAIDGWLVDSKKITQGQGVA